MSHAETNPTTPKPPQTPPLGLGEIRAALVGKSRCSQTTAIKVKGLLGFGTTFGRCGGAVTSNSICKVTSSTSDRTRDKQTQNESAAVVW
eukprot:6467156-Amphidinium_carterae.1